MHNLDGQLELYGEDLARDFRFRLSDVEKELLEMERRGNDFFDETLRIGRIFDLLSHRKLQSAPSGEGGGRPAPRRVERQVEQVVEWMVDSDLRQWRAMAEHLERRRREHEDRIVGTMSRGFEHDRARLLEEARRSAQRALESYDRDAESSRLADSVRVAVAGTAALQVGALGLGTIVTMVASTAAVDMTGILAAGALSAIGLLVLPARRAGAKSELREKVEAMRTKLLSALVVQFEQERGRSLQRLREAIAPYTRFVRAERERAGRGRHGPLAHPRRAGADPGRGRLGQDQGRPRPRRRARPPPAPAWPAGSPGIRDRGGPPPRRPRRTPGTRPGACRALPSAP